MINIIAQVLALIAWILLFVYDWHLGLMLFFIMWGNNTIKK